MDLLKQPWPWYVAGAIVGLTVPALLLLGNKHFGISAQRYHRLVTRADHFRFEFDVIKRHIL